LTAISSAQPAPRHAPPDPATPGLAGSVFLHQLSYGRALVTQHQGLAEAIEAAAISLKAPWFKALRLTDAAGQILLDGAALEEAIRSKPPEKAAMAQAPSSPMPAEARPSFVRRARDLSLSTR